MDKTGSVVHMFSTPVVGNEVTIELYPFEANHWDDPCFAGNDYEFCVQMEFYGKALGWCALKLIYPFLSGRGRWVTI